MNNNIMLVTQIQVKQEKFKEFEQIIKQMAAELTKFKGYISQDVHRPNPPLQLDWSIIQYFTSAEFAKNWLQSTEHQNILQEASALLINMNNVSIVEPGKQERNTITAAIRNKINPADEQKFLNWQLRIAPIESKFPGFLGYKLERPKTGIDDNWIAIVTFDTEEHLEAWLASTERKKMLDELHTFSDKENIEKIYSGFNFWFTDSKSNQSKYKENMLVLLTLYPVVYLLSYVQNPIMKLGVPFWLALFFSNLISTVILGNLTVPWLMQKFNWWLNPKEDNNSQTTTLGSFIVLILYIISLCICWLMSKIKGL